MRHRPQRAHTTEVVEWQMGSRRHVLDDLVSEEPLEIRVNGTAVSVTMRTPGDDFELAAGFLCAEGIVATAAEISRIAYGRGPDEQLSGNVVDVILRDDIPVDLDRFRRNFVAASSCGVCGKASIDAVRTRGLTRPRRDAAIDPDRLCALAERLRPAQALFRKTGGLHAAALFDATDRLVSVREDVGRHNAVDKIVGHAVLERRIPLSSHLLLVSGRGGFEIVQKALVAGIPVLASVSAPSSLAVRLAREYDLTLIGFLRERRFVVYAGEGRMTWRGTADGQSADLVHHPAVEGVVD
jgi:FdhD protein